MVLEPNKTKRNLLTKPPILHKMGHGLKFKMYSYKTSREKVGENVLDLGLAKSSDI